MQLPAVDRKIQEGNRGLQYSKKSQKTTQTSIQIRTCRLQIRPKFKYNSVISNISVFRFTLSGKKVNP